MRSLRGATGAVAAIALIAGGCGSHSGKPVKFGGQTYSPSQIASRFQTLTGYALRMQTYRGGWTALSPDSRAESNPSYRAFSIDVVAKPATLRTLTSGPSGPVKPDGQGIYWVRGPAFKSVPAGWSVGKVFGNLVLEVPASARVLPGTFTTLERFLSTLGAPVAVARAQLPQAPRFTGTSYTTSQVQERFYGLTGISLRLNGPHISGDDLEPDPAEGQQAYDRFGVFDLNVMDTPEGVREQIGLQKTPTPDAQGIYWSFDSHVGGGWTATKVYGNIVASELVGPRRVTASFARLESVLSRLAAAQATVRGTPPTPPKSCVAAGIGPVGQREGTCIFGHTRVTVVNRGRTLRLNGYAISVVGTTTARSLREPGLPATRARGTFLIVMLHLSNTGSTPIEVPDADVLVGSHVYKTDDAAVPALLSRLKSNALPVRAGRSMTIGIPFQMAPAMARLARRAGVVVVPGNQGETVADSFAAGISRLSG